MQQVFLLPTSILKGLDPEWANYQTFIDLQTIICYLFLVEA